MQYFRSFSARLANYLSKQGFKIIATEPNLKKPWLDVFLFEDSQELRECVTKYCQGKQ